MNGESFSFFVVCVILTAQDCLQRLVRSMAFFRQPRKRTVSFKHLFVETVFVCLRSSLATISDVLELS